MRVVLLALCAVACGIAGGLLGPQLFGESRPAASREPRRTSPRETAADPVLLNDLERRVAALEKYVRSMPPPSDRSGGTAATPPAQGGSAANPTDATGKRKEQALPKDVESLVKSLLGKEFTPALSDRFFLWLSKNKEKIGTVIEALQKEIKADPKDPELHVALATAYVADLWNNTPQGVQQGVVWAKALRAYDAALKLDPDHWQARFGKAFGTSNIPEFLGQKPAAIKQFEELRALQERGAPEPHYVSTYLRLGTLYKDMGNNEKARQVWEDGLKFFPDSQALKDALEASTKR